MSLEVFTVYCLIVLFADQSRFVRLNLLRNTRSRTRQYIKFESTMRLVTFPMFLPHSLMYPVFPQYCRNEGSCRGNDAVEK